MAIVNPLAFVVSKNELHVKSSNVLFSVPSNQYATLWERAISQFLTAFRILEQWVEIAPVIPHPLSMVIPSISQFRQNANNKQLLITPPVNVERLASVSNELSNDRFLIETFSVHVPVTSTASHPGYIPVYPPFPTRNPIYEFVKVGSPTIFKIPVPLPSIAILEPLTQNP